MKEKQYTKFDPHYMKDPITGFYIPRTWVNLSRSLEAQKHKLGIKPRKHNIMHAQDEAGRAQGIW